jgi:Sec-independent protein translocase protein TatA
MMTDLIHLSFIGPGGPEILVVMLALLVMFGSRDAPRIFRKLNDMLNQIRRTADNFRHEMMYSDIKPDESAEEEFGEYDDYGLGPDRDADGDSDGEVDDQRDDDVKSV